MIKYDVFKRFNLYIYLTHQMFSVTFQRKLNYFDDVFMEV